MSSTPSPASSPSHSEPPVSAEAELRVLVVDDDVPLARAFSRILAATGAEVSMANDGQEALQKLAGADIDVVVSDISMPGLDGVELLRAIHEMDPDMPVVFATGEPSLDTAIRAIELGAVRYLKKPLDPEALRAAVRHAATLGRVARLQRRAATIAGNTAETERSKHREQEAAFADAIDKLWIAYQPIVLADGSGGFGYEALLRSRSAVFGNPLAFLEAAEKMNRLHDLGQRVRDVAAGPMALAPERGTLFVNLHPIDLLDETLFSRDSALGRIADRVILEVTERSSLDAVRDLKQRLARLRALGYRLAVDDLGAGYSGLSWLAKIEPEVVKIDMSLVRDIDKEPTKRALVRSLIPAAHELGARVVAEGIETPAERMVLTDLGADYLQGYLLAKPGPAFPEVGLDGFRQPGTVTNGGADNGDPRATVGKA